MTTETELILRSLDDLRDDVAAVRRETREDFARIETRLDETRQLVARLEGRVDVTHDEVPPESKREKAASLVRKHAPAAGAGAAVAALIELIPEIVKLFHS
jgi:hypothetical protein